jgi:hypothetical protein
MAIFTKNTPGAPTSGLYAIGDVVTDSVGTAWTCIRAGIISTDPMQPSFSSDSNPTQIGGNETGLTAAAGGTQAGALALAASKTVHNITTVATAADSVKLPLATGSGGMHWVKNSAAVNSLQLFGSGTDTIDGVATATGVAVAAGKSRILYDLAAGQWVSLLGA